MTHDIEDYLKRVMELDRDGLNKFLTKDVLKWQKDKKVKKEESDEMLKKSEEVIIKCRNELADIWRKNGVNTPN